MLQTSFIRRASDLVVPAADLRERVLMARGEHALSDPRLADLLPPDSLMGITNAVALVVEAIASGKRVCIVGDYDADGATASAVAVRGLKMFGASVIYAVPNRMTEGYGLSPVLVQRITPLKPGLIVTVDNGIAAHEGVRAAAEAGIAVVVTDHHLPGATLPQAGAIVNPNQPGCEFPSKHLAGVGVVFYLLLAIRRHYRNAGDARGAAPLSDLLDLVALGTVADLVRLDRNNRILVAAGIQRMRSGNACHGIVALFRVAEKDIRTATTYDLGHYIAPRINAAGRLDDAGIGIGCLVAASTDTATTAAAQLNNINRVRREVQAVMESEAEAIVAAVGDPTDYTLVLHEAHWHEGCVGLVASRLKERYQRPAIVFATNSAGLLKGSARSITGLNIRDAIDEIDRALPGAIVRFGGHAMAAGLTLHGEHLEAFRAAFEACARRHLRVDHLDSVVLHDGPLSSADLTIKNAEWLRDQPWGQGFEMPSFLVDAPVRGFSLLQGKHSKLRLDIDGREIDALLFNQVIPEYSRARVHGRLSLNEWNGRKQLQLIATHVLPADEEAASMQPTHRGRNIR